MRMRSWKVFALAAGGLLILAVALVVAWGLWLGGGFEDRVAAIRAAGDPVSLADLARKSSPRERNAALALDETRGDINAVDKALTPVLRKEGFTEGRLDADDVQVIEAAFASRPELMSQLEQAAALPDYALPIDATQPPSVFLGTSLTRLDLPRQIARLLTARAHMLRAQGKPDESLHASRLLFRFCRHFDREPAIMGYLVALSCRGQAIAAANATLRSGPTSDAARAALETELARHDLTAAYVQALKSERAVGLDHYREIFGRMGLNPMRLYYMGDAGDYLDLIQRHLEWSDWPYARMTAGQLTPTGLRPLAALVAPALQQARQATERVRARLRCLRVLNVLVALDEGTGTPRLSELPLPDEAIIDPFTGRPLHVRDTDDGWLIYSEGKDRQDDGGAVADHQDIGLAPVAPADAADE